MQNLLKQALSKQELDKLSLRFRGGERLQRGQGIGGLLRLVKSVFAPLIISAGKTIVKAATSDTGKQVLRNIKDQTLETGVKLAVDALGGENMNESVQHKVQKVKCKAADGIDSMYEQRKSKKQRKAQPKPKAKVKGLHTKIEVKPMQDFFK